MFLTANRARLVGTKNIYILVISAHVEDILEERSVVAWPIILFFKDLGEECITV